MQSVDDYLHALRSERPLPPARLKALVAQFVQAHAGIESMQSKIWRGEQIILVQAFHHYRVSGEERAIRDIDRKAIQFYLTGKASLTEMTRAEFEALRLWLHMSSARWGGGDFEESISQELMECIQERQRDAARPAPVDSLVS